MKIQRPSRFTFFRALIFSFFVTSWLLPMNVLAANYYVSKSGNNSNAGTLVAPWLTIQHATNQLTAGDAVFVQGGTYNESVTLNVSGSAAGGYIYIRAFPGEIPVIDGVSLTVPASDNGLFLIKNQNYIVIDGFELKNYASSINFRTPIAIFVTGSSHHIQLRNNRIHHIESTASPSEANAHGIAVYGTHGTQSINEIVIEGNELFNLTLGNSEALVLNGNVENFSVINNRVHDNDNIGIDLIGYEGTAPVEAVDRARNGVVSGNIVYNIDSLNNPAYDGDRGADGIYVDGGTNIIIDGNRVYQSNIGIEIASEHSGKSTSHITVRNNFVYNNHIAGIAMGGYDTLRGSTEFCTVVNNTLFHNDTEKDGNGELMIQFDTRNNTIKNNIMFANDQNLLISNIYTQNTGNIVDYNLYFIAGNANDSEWQWKNQSYQGFTTYKNATGNDSNSVFTNPLFVDTSKPDLHLTLNSLAIDRGATLAASGDTDFDEEIRQEGQGTDIGADEYLSPSSMALTLDTGKWKQIGLPCNPGSANKVSDIFGDDLSVSDYSSTWVVYKYDTSNNSYVKLNVNGVLEQGTGYWITQQTGTSVIVGVPDTCTTSSVSISQQCISPKGCSEYLLATKPSVNQWNMISLPFKHEQSLNNLRIVTTTGDCSDNNGCTLDTAQSSNIFHNQMSRYNAVTSSYDLLEGASILNIWDGVWAPTLTNAHGNNPRLLIPHE